MPEWPWPGNRLARRTRIAMLYRDALAEHAPQACKNLDAVLDNFQQHWITGNKPAHINPNEPMTATEIAIWTDTSINNVCNLLTSRGIRPAGHRGKRKTYNLTDFINTKV